jgi:hypothetical protein
MLLLAVLAAWTTARETRRWHQAPFGDFNYLQTGGECLIAGCDPYDYAALNHEAEARHEKKPPIWPMTPVYPPSALLLLLPFEALGWPAAAWVFNGLAGLATALACVLMVWWMRIRWWDPAALVLVAALVCLPMASALEFANPALLEAGLITLSCLLLFETRWAAAGWILLGASVALKPQLAAGAWIVLLCRRETRAAAWKGCGVWLALLLAGTLAYRLRLGSFHFFATLRWVLWLSALPGGSSDFANTESFDFLNLQTAYALIPHASRAAIQALAWATTGLLAAAALWLGDRCDAFRRRPWTMIALLTAISLLPVYHRGYDRVIALLLAPAAVELARQRRRLAWAYASLVTLWIANDTVMTNMLRRWHFMPQNPVEDVLFCLVLLVSLWRQRRAAFEEAPLVAS